MDDQDKTKIGTLAAEEANARLITALEKRKGGLNKAALRLVQALDAKETKVFSHQGDLTYSKPLISHKIRLDAAKYIAQIHNAEPAQRRELSGPGGGPIQTEDPAMIDRVAKYFEDLKEKDGVES